MAAWIKQFTKHITKYGADAAQWYTEWDEPDGTRRCKACGLGKKGKKLATEKAERINAQLKLGTYESDKAGRVTWKEFVQRYKDKILTGLASNSLSASVASLNNFSRVLKLENKPMASLKSEAIDDFKAKRRKERGRNPDSLVSPATINKDLRFIKAALRQAVEWGYLDKAPKIKFEREPEKLATFVPPEHFTAMYEACQAATLPASIPNVPAVDWWRGVLVFAYTTGWRIAQILAVRWEDVDLDAATAVSRAQDNKGKRDTMIDLSPLVVEHLRKLQGSFQEKVFPWDSRRRSLWDEFNVIQGAAVVRNEAGEGKPLPKGGKNGFYGFHDLRRGFATLNAGKLDLFELQKIMQHRDLSTTRKYVNMATKMKSVTERLYVPNLTQPKANAVS